MEKNVNPWTGKAKTPKHTGLWNQILFKHYPQMEGIPSKNTYLEIIPLIESQKTDKSIQEYKQAFDLKSKINKMMQILDWIKKVEGRANQPCEKQETPINSSFVYVPVHSYNSFCEIMKDCGGLSREPMIKEQTLALLNTQIRELEQMLSYNQLLMSNIL